MNVTIDQEGCIGCGLCAGTCPDVFAMDDATGKACVTVKEVPAGMEDTAREAADGCPVSVIHVEG